MLSFPPRSWRWHRILIYMTNRKMVRGRDACWEHCVLVDATRQKVRCNYCHREFSGGVYRMKFHLAQIKNKDIVPCTDVPNDVRDLIQNILNTPKKQKTSKKQREVDRQQNGQQDSSSASGGLNPNHISSGRHGSTCPSLPIRHPSLNVQPPSDDLQKQKHEDADKKVASFFIHNSLPFSASKSVYYQAMVDAIAECGAGYKAPCYERLRSNLLNKLKGDVNDSYKKFQEERKDVGCTILSDCWSDGRGVSLVVFSVTCPRGTFFLKSVDVSSHADDAHYLFGLLESVVMEVGLENVVQVITGSSASYVYAGHLLTAKYPSVFCMPCASYCIDKMLEDISRHEWVNLVLEEAKTITNYIYGHAWLSNLMRKFTCGMDIVRPRIKRFASYFLSLRAIVVQEDNLKHMFSHAEYLSSAYSRRSEAQAVKSLLYLEKFWKLAHEAVGVTEPLLKLLRIVDGDIPAMGYVYEGMEKAKVVIKAFYKGIEEKYLPIWEIIDRRWNVQHHSPLYAAAAFLNPSIFYNAHFKIDLKVRNGFQEAMLKMLTEDKDKIELTKEHPMYINAHGALGTDFAILGRALNSPGDWWAGYGYEVPTLQRAAIRILNQPCSSYWCRWDWNTFQNLHAKRWGEMEQEKFSDWVFVHFNLHLQALTQNRVSNCKPVIFDEIDISRKWPTEWEPSNHLLDDSWLENFPFDFRCSPLAYD